MERKIVPKDRRKKHQRTRVLHGYVLNFEGAKIPNAKVEVLQRGLIKMKGCTDSSGYLAFFALPLGFYEVKGSAKGYFLQTQMAKIQGNESAALIFELFEEVSSKENKVRRVLTYINSHFYQPLNLGFCASPVELYPDYFSRKF